MSSREFEEKVREPRPLTPDESALISALLSVPFAGREALSTQAGVLAVRPLDADGSLELAPSDGPRADVVGRIPVEGELEDLDGVTIHVLLHVVDGYLNELEIYREDSRPILRQIKAADVSLVVP